jgi:hypothetical protein
LNFAVGWKVEATEEEYGMEDLVDLPICKEEVQWSRLKKESQPREQLDEIIEEIRRLMIRSVEAVNKVKLTRGEPAIVVGKQKQQQQRSDGADEQIQRSVWDLGGFRQPCWEAHEQELMNFSQQRSMMQEHYPKPTTCHPTNTSKSAFNGRREAQPSHFANF